MVRLTFIGFGEAAYHMAKGLAGASLHGIRAYDMMQNDSVRGAIMRRRAQETGTQLVSSLEEACAGSDFVLSLTSARAAFPGAQAAVPLLHSEQTYVDMNSASPDVKRSISELSRAAGVRFCDAAVMGTVPGNEQRVPIFLAGDGAKRFYEAMTPYGMKLTVLDAEAGGASAIKMLKSVIMKGLPQLMLESFEAAEKYGVLETLVASLDETLCGKSVEKLADTFFARTMINAARRGDEMRDVRATLNRLCVDSTMTEAAIRKLDALAEERWAETLGSDGGDMGYQDAIRLLITRHVESNTLCS